MQIERAMAGVTALGPGNRLAIWVNGCKRRCKGCVSPELQAFNPNNEREIADFFEGFSFDEIDGITISGGEPFEQVSELRKLVDYSRQSGCDDILIYTGYTYDELKSREDEDINYILSKISVLIDGEYIEEQDDDKSALRGSTNQRIIFLNTKYKKKYEAYSENGRMQQILDLGFYVLGVGIPNKKFITEFRK